MSQPISFSFGENWKDFVKTVSEEALLAARADVAQWLGEAGVRGRRVLDIGCGSGIHSLGFYSLGAQELVSFDLDPKSVEATRSLWEKAGKPDHWTVLQGSVLDRAFLDEAGPGTFDVVYAWGVLHHTGAMWDAVDAACRMVAPGGRLWLALYVKRPSYPRELALKKRYNAASPLGKKLMVATALARLTLSRLYARQNPFRWKKERGMDIYHDTVDWLGGLPYEVASEEEVVLFTRQRGFVLERVRTGEANTIYLLSRAA
jgi:2-polyprenyl-6-hydroxyphenyl methylase/3-demethylubiquinone-9 3-methyltransferase